MENALLIRELEEAPYYELVEIFRFEVGRRYVYRLVAEREYFVHVVALREATYVEFWHPSHAAPLLVFKVSDREELARVLLLLKSLVSR